MHVYCVQKTKYRNRTVSQMCVCVFFFLCVACKRGRRRVRFPVAPDKLFIYLVFVFSTRTRALRSHRDRQGYRQSLCYNIAAGLDEKHNRGRTSRGKGEKTPYLLLFVLYGNDNADTIRPTRREHGSVRTSTENLNGYRRRVGVFVVKPRRRVRRPE